MSDQLDILALEPFYGGIRKSMLEALIRRSRHRWTLLKLPPRRIDRRLAAAAQWFAEQLARHWVGQLDLLFTSEAMNLADLVRLLPMLAQKPSVVYYHANQLPDPPPERITGRDVVNLATAQVASELWFNSNFHMENFARRTSALITCHPELSSHDPVPEMLAKSRLMPPPIDLNLKGDSSAAGGVQRRRQTIFVETRDADMRLLNHGLKTLHNRGEKFNLMTVGPVKELSTEFPRTTLPEWDDSAHAAAMLQSDVFLSAHRAAALDPFAVRAMVARCWPVVPADGFYGEIIPENLQERCLYDCTPEELANCVQDAWYMELPEAAGEHLQELLKKFDVATVCRAMDDRLSEVVVGYALAAERAIEEAPQGQGQLGEGEVGEAETGINAE